MMEIEIGKLYINKTWRYLTPSLRGHGEVFIEKFNRLFKLAVGIHDTLLDGSELSNGRNIYVLVDKKYKPEEFKEFMNFLEYQPYFKGDYCPSVDILKSRKHMIILDIPEKFNVAYDSFLRGEYSKMYSKKYLELFFSVPEKTKEYSILSKSGDSLEEFAREVSKEFGTIANPKDFDTAERDLPLKKVEEIFHYKNSEVFFNEDTDKIWQT